MIDIESFCEERMLTPAELADVVKCQREENGWTQETLAELSKLNTRTVQRVERGDPSDLDTRRAIASALGWSDIDIHKIGVTSGDVSKRLANAKLDPTFLMADVEVVATYELSNINRTKLENLLHRFFEPAKLNIEIKDRFGNPIVPREWFLVPLFVIDEIIEKIKDGTIVDYSYDISKQEIRKK